MLSAPQAWVHQLLILSSSTLLQDGSPHDQRWMHQLGKLLYMSDRQRRLTKALEGNVRAKLAGQATVAPAQQPRPVSAADVHAQGSCSSSTSRGHSGFDDWEVLKGQRQYPAAGSTLAEPATAALKGQPAEGFTHLQEVSCQQPSFLAEKPTCRDLAVAFSSKPAHSRAQAASLW